MRKAAFVLSLLLLTINVGFAYSLDVAVVVNKQNPVSGVSLAELTKILKQEKQYWEGGKKVYLILQEAGSSEKNVMLKRVYQMSDEDLKKFWLGKMFRGEISSFPKTLGSSEAVKRFISQVPNAIGFIDSGSVDTSIKALNVDGKSPGDKGYPLSSE